ncbi:tRNA glutamyl-Q(34) synthetase GluQRS [Acidipropionibacterium jensenii]|uniref:tRNA glutamyl-Q(34) synthetase GluQRS n=1 Tax=Acidipropionibacterium jensenii TaxID=1749 RepID=A0A3Q9UJY5_9ACTN|nr:tRNA glutamyl-Q(34) synthetase GluQRS [Acidipropionibacterium jensenii]MDN6556331.1 tRNA glutamyl-Q(34) synthetase GluQRS [Acidipropionibacterium acidipropionici]AZZ39235.1 tRNA glutamyl-Q(34) synthetase GluQRS [Acidipropionibacterium jensenii]MDN5977159.1 tRNA glutamyl-Q(34) synthetase GluQRS [Acidipropionibacterium jensenii]MDN5996033.1 tRNA glutamyl-Q(34) synthetase GluQRS [Acidipropionibacterium jensenii]MDN6021819.1 tRNA glutamyl-Q(34) synthetase GluQRS [Acidipropionibacterium jensenii
MDSAHLPGHGRFAPSPTSALHLGNLRTALVAWLLARRSGRGFVVRVEDLDQVRVAAAGDIADQQLRDLEALGLDWDGPVVRQSARLEIYAEMARRLPSYPCFCTRREIAAASRAPDGNPRSGEGDWLPYPGTCRGLSRSRRAEFAGRRPPALRLAAPVHHWTVHDLARGTQSGRVDDVVLRRNDGTWAYNLAVVVDDGLQGVDQVVRARDLWPSAPRQAMIADLLGLPAPGYAHTGLVTGPGGKRLAKARGAAGMAELAAGGLSAARVRAVLCRSLGLPEVDRLTDLLAGDPGIDAALRPPRGAAADSAEPGPLEAGPLAGPRGWWSDVALDAPAEGTSGQPAGSTQEAGSANRMSTT